MKALRKFWNENYKKGKKKNNKQGKNKNEKLTIENIEQNLENEKIIKEENENQNSKANSENSNINSEELNQITKEIEDININETKKEDSISSISEEDEYIYTNKKENLDEIKQDFLNNKEAKDFLNNRGKINNNKNDYYTTINGQLNNPNNPFIEAKDILYSEKKRESESQNYNIEKINIEPELKGEKGKELINPENNLKKNPKKLDKSNAKEINGKDIYLDENNLKGDIKAGNYWYTKFSFLDKQFYIMTKTSVAEKNDDIIYYCNMHNTTIESNESYKNGRKKKMPKCNARIYYNKAEKKYYLETEHSEYCNNKVKEKYTNDVDLNAAINNYKNFKEELIKFLNLNPIIKYTDFKEKATKLYYKNNCQFKILENTFKNIYYNRR